MRKQQQLSAFVLIRKRRLSGPGPFNVLTMMRRRTRLRLKVIMGLWTLQ